MLDTTIPYQVPAETPLRARNTTGEGAVPCTFSVPSTVSSIRDVSRLDPIRSPDSKCSCAPAWMVSERPAGTVRSPGITCGLPAAVSVVFVQSTP